METKLKRWLLIAAVIVVGLLYVIIQQNLTIAQQKHEMVKELQTLISSQHDQVALQQQLYQASQALKSCQK